MKRTKCSRRIDDEIRPPVSPRGTAGERKLRLRSLLPMLALLLLAGMLVIPGAEAQRPNGAGVVIRHGDGTLIYAYVPFEEESISGEELLVRTGLDLTFAPYGGLGAGVCRIQDEGCPADNCYCHSYSTPAFYWHYYTYQDGGWVEAPFGATSREVRDGDIDGWSWTSGDHGLPPVTIDEIAAINGVDRNPPTPTEPPPPTATPSPTPVLPTNTPPPPTETPAPEPTATVTPAPEPEAASTATFTPQPKPTSTDPPTVTATPVATSTATATSTPEEVAQRDPSPAATDTATPQPTSRAVIVRPSATPEALEIEDDDGGSRDFVMFGALAAGVAIIGAGAVLYRRMGGP